MNIVHVIIEIISLCIASFGVLIIFLGSVRSFWDYCLKMKIGEDYTHSRSLLASHLVLGLDFFIGTDIIDTLLLYSSGDNGHIWQELASLVVVVTIRILVNHFLLEELREIKKSRWGFKKK